jgi:putative endonuclease
MWFVYILLCADDSYYIGITDNVAKRFETHLKGKGGAYTRSHKPKSIIYIEECPNRSTALKREIQLKKLSKIQKKMIVLSNLSNNL